MFLWLLLRGRDISTCFGKRATYASQKVQRDGLESFFAVAAANLAGLLPSSPGSIGTFHYFAVWALAAHGIPWNVAAALALVIHAVFFLPLTLMGLGLIEGRYVRAIWCAMADPEDQVTRMQKSRRVKLQ